MQVSCPRCFDSMRDVFMSNSASEKDPEHVLQIIREHLQPDQIVFVGVIDPIDPAVETAEQVRDPILLAAK